MLSTGSHPSDVPGIQRDVEAPTLEELQRWRSRMGPKLRALDRSQKDKHPPVRCTINLTQLQHVSAHAVSLACQDWRLWYRGCYMRGPRDLVDWHVTGRSFRDRPAPDHLPAGSICMISTKLKLYPRT